MYGIEGCYGDEAEHGTRDLICYEALDPIKLKTPGRGPEDPMLCNGTYCGPRPNCPRIIGMVEPREDHCFDRTAVTGTKIKINHEARLEDKSRGERGPGRTICWPVP
ncbi:hypothetical protein NC652_002871 [Populus alba x Populus x berolinensis]|uniref:Uncharacterized protein n=1 Tax=Populus alba x Populus x berolinensis TaxID=444605 RepID=A0AAD6RQ50_9ROSI|nr:hypothetical protein NC652_002871 [Populus alba x Populus x berolinensis]KAJ7013093.1 hypothetical protein NC653_002954 [Populus alba x Populus x berolinensis]